jgi:hypothetical protein
MPSSPHSLGAVFAQVQAGLCDPANHYLVTTSYFETDHGPYLLGTVYLQRDAVWDLAVDAGALTCQVLLTPHERHPIRVPFANVWQVLHGDRPHFNADQADVLYEDDQVLARFAREGLPE